MSHTPTDARHGLQAAVIGVAEHSLFAFCDVLDRAVFDAAVETRPAGWLRARVAFHGPAAGAVEVSLPAPLVRDLAGAFVGESPDMLDDQTLVDFAGELANMACGAWLTQGFPADAFDLAPPVVEAGLDIRAGLATTTDEDALYLAVNEVPVLIRLTWYRGPAPTGGA